MRTVGEVLRVGLHSHVSNPKTTLRGEVIRTLLQTARVPRAGVRGRSTRQGDRMLEIAERGELHSVLRPCALVCAYICPAPVAVCLRAAAVCVTCQVAFASTAYKKSLKYKLTHGP